VHPTEKKTESEKRRKTCVFGFRVLERPRNTRRAAARWKKKGKTKKETHTFVFATRRVRCIPRSPMPIGSSHTQSPVTSGHVSAHISRMIDPTQRDSRARQRQSRFPGASHDSALTKSDALRPNSLCTFMTRLWRRFTGLEALRAPRRCRPPRAAIRRVERQ